MNFLKTICRLCLCQDINTAFTEISILQHKQFIELFGAELPTSIHFPTWYVCIDCSSDLEKFYLYKQQLLRKQKDLMKFLDSKELIDAAESNCYIDYEDVVKEDDDDDFIVETLEEENILDDNYISEELVDDDIIVEDYHENETRDEGDENDYALGNRIEELRFEPIEPKLILTPNFLLAREFIRNPDLDLISLINPPDVDSLFTCFDCNISFESEGELMLHKNDHDNSISGDFECTFCRTTFKSKINYEKHTKEQHNQSFICEFCVRTFKDKKDLKSHLRSHDLTKKYKCTFDDCEKSFRHQHHLKNHLRVHMKISPFKCELCNASFRQNYALTLHRKKHLKEFIECSKCKSQFIMQSQLNKHKCTGTFKAYSVRTRKLTNKIN